MTAQGVTVVRNHVEETVGHQQIVVDYPTFSCEDPRLELYLTDRITAPIQALQRRGQMAQDDACLLYTSPGSAIGTRSAF